MLKGKSNAFKQNKEPDYSVYLSVLIIVMIGEFLGEILGYAIFEILFNKIISPCLKIIGTFTRWLCSFGKISFKTIYIKDYNTRLGLVVSLILIFALMFVFFDY